MLGYFFIFSPTVTDWEEIIASRTSQLLNVEPQMNALLKGTQQDVYNQFDEKQSEWKPLRPYTVRKKASMDADPRILHETKFGEGLRLRDAYADSGYVDSNHVMIYTYPVDKPYAKDHQEGATIDVENKEYTGRRRKNQSLARAIARMDKEYGDIFNRG